MWWANVFRHSKVCQLLSVSANSIMRYPHYKWEVFKVALMHFKLVCTIIIITTTVDFEFPSLNTGYGEIQKNSVYKIRVSKYFHLHTYFGGWLFIFS